MRTLQKHDFDVLFVIYRIHMNIVDTRWLVICMKKFILVTIEESSQFIYTERELVYL